jgi:flagellar hook-length control protein FliK
MSAILLNSESKLSHCINNNSLESDNLSDEGLFNSLFVIISQKSEDNLILGNNPLIDQENIVADNLNIENQENEIFPIISEKILLNEFKKISNLENNKKDFLSNQNQSSTNNSLAINFEILNNKTKKEFSKNLSEVVNQINDKSLTKTISTTSIDQKFVNKEFIDFIYKKSDNSVVNIKENIEEFNQKRLKFKEFKTSLDNIGTKYLDQDLFFENNKDKNLITKTSIVNVYRGITPIKNQNFSKSDNTSSSHQINTITQNNNIFNQYSGSSFTGSNFAGNNSFYSGSGNSLEYLNMLDRNWSTSLLNKIEKGIKNGDETLEISLKPRNLGNLKISLSLNNDSAKINIVTENSSAALLLSEAESKLSQMLENTGLKLSNFSTGLDQGKKHNTKNGNQNNTDKKMLAKDEISLEKGDQLVSRINSENQILNLLA